MNKWLITGAVLGFLMLATVGILVMVGIGYSNDEIALRNTFNAQVDVNKSNFDKMWKVINKKAQVTEKYSEDFRKNFSAIMEGRYGNAENRTQSMFNWIKEQNPNMDATIYKDLSTSLEALHNEFDMVQKKMISIKKNHDDLRTKFPSSIIVGSRPELVLQLVLSDKTDESFKSGKDNDTDVF